MRARSNAAAILRDLELRMVFLSGPRQVGKTTLALGLLGPNAATDHPAYLNWDSPGVARQLLAGELPLDQPLLVLDELHKYLRWRNLVKGIFDRHRSTRRILVTGSARLDLYRRGGDSLQGRYFHHRLHPFSLPELDSDLSQGALEQLLRFGGFPEPLHRADDMFWKRWQKDHVSRLVREDIRDLERVRELSLIEILAEALPDRVGAPLSVRNLRQDLQVDHKTAERWITILEALFYCFRISPYGAPRIRAVTKERKLYLWDWSLVQDPAARFENLVASHLLKLCHFREDTLGERMELCYLRDVDRREVDFVVLRDRKPWFAVECKTAARSISPSIRYFQARTPIPTWYQVHLGEESWEREGVIALPFAELCRRVEVP